MNEANSNYFKLFSTCIIVEGATRSIICDIQLNRYKSISKLLIEVLSASKGITINRLKDKYHNELDKVIDNFLNYLIENNWGFVTNIPDNFPSLNLKWNYPGVISNAIIDIDKNVNQNLAKAIKELELLGCESVQLRFYNNLSATSIFELLELFQYSKIRYLELYLKYNDIYTDIILEKILQKNERLRIIYITNSDKNRIFKINDFYGKVFFSIKDVDINLDCGNISKLNFSTNIKLFTEGQKYNTCLNRKVSIDINGNIKNCPAMKQVFGNIEKQTLREVVDLEKFKSLWYIAKDQITICKDCEFRYICTDCRAYIEDENDIFSKPKKCNYNPYEAKWH